MGQMTPKEIKKRTKVNKAIKDELGTKIITVSKVKEYFKAHKMNMTADAADAVAKELYALLYKAVKRAGPQGRNVKTIRPLDL